MREELGDADDFPPRPGRIVAAMDIGTSRIAAVYTHVPRDEHDKRGLCYFAVGSPEGKEVAAVLLKLRDPSLTHVSSAKDVELCHFGEEALRKHKELALNPDGQVPSVTVTFRLILSSLQRRLQALFSPGLLRSICCARPLR